MVYDLCFMFYGLRSKGMVFGGYGSGVGVWGLGVQSMFSSTTMTKVSTFVLIKQQPCRGKSVFPGSVRSTFLIYLPGCRVMGPGLPKLLPVLLFDLPFHGSPVPLNRL